MRRDCIRELPVNDAEDTKLIVHDEIINAEIRVGEMEQVFRRILFQLGSLLNLL